MDGKKLKNHIVRYLRQAFYYSGLYNKVLGAFRIKRGVYFCALCMQEFGRKEIQVDHKEAVQLTSDWNEIIDRMFDVDNCQVVCKPCHKDKTKIDIKKIKENKNV